MPRLIPHFSHQRIFLSFFLLRENYVTPANCFGVVTLCGSWLTNSRIRLEVSPNGRLDLRGLAGSRGSKWDALVCIACLFVRLLVGWLAGWLACWLVGGWVGLGWVGLGWVGLGWVGLGWVGLGWVGLGWVGLGWVGLGWWEGGLGWEGGLVGGWVSWLVGWVVSIIVLWFCLPFVGVRFGWCESFLVAVRSVFAQQLKAMEPALGWFWGVLEIWLQRGPGALTRG